MSTLDLTLKPEATTLRRLEVITGTGRRRQFSEDFKAGIVEETLAQLAGVPAGSDLDEVVAIDLEARETASAAILRLAA